MAEYFALQAAIFFSIGHIMIRRGLVESNAMTGAFISLSMSAVILWSLLVLMVPLTSLWTPIVFYFIAAGIFAPGIGRTLSFVGIERIGVARSVPIVNSSPIFASLFAVIFLGEVWAGQNIVGTLLVIAGVVLLSMIKPAERTWRKRDVIYPVVGAVAFGISATLRKAGLDLVNIPVLAAAVTAGTAALFSFATLQFQGRHQAFKLTRKSASWLFPASVFNSRRRGPRAAGRSRSPDRCRRPPGPAAPEAAPTTP
jgi:uncharacterized membrane protein